MFAFSPRIPRTWNSSPEAPGRPTIITPGSIYGFKASRNTRWANAGSTKVIMSTPRTASSGFLVIKAGLDLMMLGSWSRRWQVISRSAVCMILLHRSASSWYKLSTLTSVPPCDEAIPAKAWAPLPLPQIRSLILSVITSFLENWLNYKFNFVFTTSKPWRFSTNGK